VQDQPGHLAVRAADELDLGVHHLQEVAALRFGEDLELRLAGGLGAFFLLMDKPEVYGLPNKENAVLPRRNNRFGYLGAFFTAAVAVVAGDHEWPGRQRGQRSGTVGVAERAQRDRRVPARETPEMSLEGRGIGIVVEEHRDAAPLHRVTEQPRDHAEPQKSEGAFAQHPSRARHGSSLRQSGTASISAAETARSCHERSSHMSGCRRSEVLRSGSPRASLT